MTTEQLTSELPKISIITPSYNQGHFIEATIKSVLDQGYPNLEYIIIDGGSNDNTTEVIRKYESKIDYWVSEKDKGQSDAINKGFQKATGDILHWLNSDDLLLPGALNAIGAFFRDNPDIDCAIGDLEVIDVKGDVISSKKAIPFDFNTALYSACLVPQPATPFRRIAWERTGEVDLSLRYQMDFEYYLRMAHKGGRFGLIKKPIAQFRLHGDSKTVSEYDNLVWKANRQIQEPYLSGRLRGNASSETLLRLLNWVYRTRSLIVRAFIRGDFMPFKATVARRSI